MFTCLYYTDTLKDDHVFVFDWLHSQLIQTDGLEVLTNNICLHCITRDLLEVTLHPPGHAKCHLYSLF